MITLLTKFQNYRVADTLINNKFQSDIIFSVVRYEAYSIAARISSRVILGKFSKTFS